MFGKNVMKETKTINAGINLLTIERTKVALDTDNAEKATKTYCV